MKKRIALVMVLFAFYAISLFYISEKTSERVSKSAENYYNPVRSSGSSGGVFCDSDDETIKKSTSFLHITNHSSYEKRVTFVLHQHDFLDDSDYFFDIDKIYINTNTDEETILYDEIVVVPPGEKLFIRIDATARDSSEVLTSREGPFIQIVTLDDFY